MICGVFGVLIAGRISNTIKEVSAEKPEASSSS